MLTISGYKPTVDTRLSVRDPSDGTKGATIDLEDDLALSDRETLPMASVKFRFTQRHALEFSFVSLDRDARSTVPYTFEFGGREFEIGIPVETQFDSDIYRLRYQYSFINSPKNEFAGSFGVHVMDFNAGINVIRAPEQQFHELTAPLPVIGLMYRHHFTDHLSIGANADWLALEIGDYKGRVLNGNAGLDWFPWRNIGFGLGYEYYSIRIEADRSDFDGKVDYEFRGPTVSAKLRF
jgi:hypothetical protein